ncbi:MAG: hypothetical protein PHO37_04070 [Kiritimatiellae bacterium]|nr:hypothetical protein [Kiritimatiellia bacterium]
MSSDLDFMISVCLTRLGPQAGLRRGMAGEYIRRYAVDAPYIRRYAVDGREVYPPLCGGWSRSISAAMRWISAKQAAIRPDTPAP